MFLLGVKRYFVVCQCGKEQLKIYAVFGQIFGSNLVEIVNYR